MYVCMQACIYSVPQAGPQPAIFALARICSVRPARHADGNHDIPYMHMRTQR